MAGARISFLGRNWNVFKSDGLVLYPPESFVINKGFDGSGTHGRRDITIGAERTAELLSVPNYPVELAVSLEEYAAVTNHLLQMNRKSALDYFRLARKFLFGLIKS